MSAFSDPFTVVLDTNVLVPALGRNLLLTFAEQGFFRPRWSDQIRIEFARTFAKIYPDASPETESRIWTAMHRAFPEAAVAVDLRLVEALSLPDSDDRHILAAAIQTAASLVVTENIRDFPLALLNPHHVAPIRLDDFLSDVIDMAGPDAVAAVHQMRLSFSKPEIDADQLLLMLEKRGLVECARLLTPYRALL